MNKNIICLALVLAGCATPRHKYNDATMRILIDPASINEPTQYGKLQAALTTSGKFFLVDRGVGFEAMLKEQDREHKGARERFDNREKWSRWGKMYGVGGIVTGHADCDYKTGWRGVYWVCDQNLSIVDASTGIVMASITNTSEAETGRNQNTASWDETVDKLVAAYPKVFETREYDERLKKYQDESERNAK